MRTIRIPKSYRDQCSAILHLRFSMGKKALQRQTIKKEDNQNIMKFRTREEININVSSKFKLNKKSNVISD